MSHCTLKHESYLCHVTISFSLYIRYYLAVLYGFINDLKTKSLRKEPNSKDNSFINDSLDRLNPGLQYVVNVLMDFVIEYKESN